MNTDILVSKDPIDYHLAPPSKNIDDEQIHEKKETGSFKIPLAPDKIQPRQRQSFNALAKQ